jgi:hypothetical protein
LLAREARSFVGNQDFKPHDRPILPALTSEELTSLVDIWAITTPTAKIPAIHLARLVLLGYVVMSPDGPRVTGDGLIRITESS